MSPILESLNAESSILVVDSCTKDRQLIKLRLAKARKNLNNAILSGLSRDAVIDIEDRLLSVEFNVLHQDSHIGIPRKNVKDDTSLLADNVELNMMSSDTRLRRREPASKVDVNQHYQEELSSDLVSMAAEIKKNAQQFQAKLEADADLIGSTSDSIIKTSGNMSSVGGRLAKYRRESQLGWMFYIWSALFIMFSLIFGMTLIQLFGKW